MTVEEKIKLLLEKDRYDFEDLILILVKRRLKKIETK